jgi:3-isopropylmalate/(R)-2-methylmalate dehydratase small subunit
VISTSFADIFYNNCFKNGILPIVVSANERDALLADAADIENPELSIDLVSQTIRRPNGVTISFEVDAFRKKCLLEGFDDIGLTMEKSSAIDNFEAARSQSQPWL